MKKILLSLHIKVIWLNYYSIVPSIIDDPTGPLALVTKMVELKIIEEPENYPNINLYELKFTKEFDNSLIETIRRLGFDPSNKKVSLGQGLRSMLLNYVGSEIDEHQLDEIIMMVFSLKTVNSVINDKK